ncbi:MAG TPA: cytochrome c [Candidatus Binatia bacterium]|nr:cytochrome c [Candidatus Binatia bacterium]
MSQARESMSKTWVLVRVMALVVALGAGWVVPNCVRAEDDLQNARDEAGRIWYEKYCMPCHGKGGAPGSAVYPNSKEPVDLRVYVQRHGGKFPAGQWFSVVFGPQPGLTHHTDVWNKIRSQHQTSIPTGNAEARGIVASIAEYVISVQTK